MVDMADVADVVQRTVRDHMGGAIQDAIRPYTERAPALQDYASALVELERKKGELGSTPRTRGCLFGRYARLLALGKGSWERGVREAGQRSAWGSDDPVVKSVTKALTSSDPAGAGSIILPAVAAEFIDLLRAKSRIRSIARILPMAQGALTIRKIAAGASAFYIGESSNVTPSQPTVGNVTLNFKKLVALTPVSNSLLRQSAGEADMMVRDDLAATMAAKFDLEAFYGDGSENKIVGLLHLMATSNQGTQAGTTLANRMSDLKEAVTDVETSDLDLEDGGAAWIMSSRLFWELYGVPSIISTDVAGFPFAAGLSQTPPRLLGFPVLKTNRVDSTGNAPYSRHDLWFVHGPSVLIGDSVDLQLEAFDGAAYFDGSAVVSGVSRDETVIRAISEHDLGLRYDRAVAMSSGITVT